METNMLFNLSISICTLIVSAIILLKLFYKSGGKNNNFFDYKYKPFVEIPVATAEGLATRFRGGVEKADLQTNAVVYEGSEIISYIGGNFWFFTTKVELSSPYVWRLSLCPMYKTDKKDGLVKLTVGLMPIIIHTTSDTAYDFFECRKKPTDPNFKDCLAYYVALDALVVSKGYTSFIYDEGHLYP